MNNTIKSQRLLSLDVFRGLTVALMILVNSLDKNAYSFLKHANWHGCTLADLVFPFFIFIVGTSCALTFFKFTQQGFSTKQLIIKILKRSTLLFLIGLLLNAWPNHFNLDHIRIFGVLQRIAICYFFVSLIYITTSTRIQIICLITLLIGYWLAMTKIFIPGFGINNLTMEGNLATYIDKLFININHLYKNGFDPEGLFTTLPAIATGLLGSLLGTWLLSSYKTQQKLTGILITGFLILLIGWFWGLSFPINKSLWSSSYVLYTGGIALLIFALCYYLNDILKWTKWSKPLEIFGKNAMLVFILHVLFLKTQAILYIKTSMGIINLRQLITNSFFMSTSFLNPSLLYAIASIIFWFILIAIYHYRKIKQKNYIRDIKRSLKTI